MIVENYECGNYFIRIFVVDKTAPIGLAFAIRIRRLWPADLLASVRPVNGVAREREVAASRRLGVVRRGELLLVLRRRFRLVHAASHRLCNRHVRLGIGAVLAARCRGRRRARRRSRLLVEIEHMLGGQMTGGGLGPTGGRWHLGGRRRRGRRGSGCASGRRVRDRLAVLRLLQVVSGIFGRNERGRLALSGRVLREDLAVLGGVDVVVLAARTRRRRCQTVEQRPMGRCARGRRWAGRCRAGLDRNRFQFLLLDHPDGGGFLVDNVLVVLLVVHLIVFALLVLAVVRNGGAAENAYRTESKSNEIDARNA